VNWTSSAPRKGKNLNPDNIDIVKPFELRIGDFVDLDTHWLKHPFPSGRFKIKTAAQLKSIHELGLSQVRITRSNSDFLQNDISQIANEEMVQASHQASAKSLHRIRQSIHPRNKREMQRSSLTACERRFAESVRQFRLTIGAVQSDPQVASQHSLNAVSGMVGEMLFDTESSIRLLSEVTGDKNSIHAINVTVISLLLGKAMGLSRQQLLDLGLSALLHDIGKIELPSRMHWFDESFSSAELRLYQEHVAKGVMMCQRMELSQEVLAAIAQHHELADGSGFPSKVKVAGVTPAARILALVNRYDNLINPSKASAALTPHEAMSTLYIQFKTRFDTVALSAFIRMMGVYPPGSVVQLIDERHAMVVSVNSARPLKPRVIVHEAGVSKHDALILDLELSPDLGIRKSIRPSSLPSAVMEYLEPRQKLAYYFESLAATSDQDVVKA